MTIVRLILLLLWTAPVLAKPAPDSQFDIAGQPSPSDWEYFFKLDDATRMKLWTFHKSRERELSAWSWEWRLAWVRTCMQSDRKYCKGIIQQALSDKALVVRAETAMRLGKRFAGTKNRDVIKDLAKLYKDKRNVRNGKPMFIQQRILYAISEIGGDFAVQTGARLAAEDTSMTSYWTKISRL